MIKPNFFIRDVITYMPKNRAHNIVVDAVRNLQGLTILNLDDLKSFVQFLKDTADDANNRFPRCKKLEVSSWCDPQDGHRQISVKVEGSVDTYVCSVNIVVIRGEWTKGGLR